jgi:hypothetical protein
MNGEWQDQSRTACEISPWLMRRLLFVHASFGDVQMPEKDLNRLSRLVDDALATAVQMDEKTAAFILSMASLEVSHQIEAIDNTEPDDKK